MNKAKPNPQNQMAVRLSKNQFERYIAIQEKYIATDAKQQAMMYASQVESISTTAGLIASAQEIYEWLLGDAEGKGLAELRPIT